ncbi:uncharacterized protein JCM15063_000389 [Sporobolomyces koalae]|uniref:uncharacterized protein n=1 Tax=Sporobolomyces koalae TaxID=500713 RepID=UPI003170F10F
MPHLSALPAELVRDIVYAFLEENPAHVDRVPNLASLARVNRNFHALANPLLYRKLLLDTPRRSQILATLHGNPTLAREVRQLTLFGGELSVEDFDSMKEVLSRCINVISLTYLCFDTWFLPALTAFIAKTWSSRLRYLRCDRKEGLWDLLCQSPSLEELVASSIDFPSRLPSGQSTTSLLTPKPSFHLRRFDSGSSPLVDNFEALLSSSQDSLVELDLPISSLSPLPDLSAFPCLANLTLTLAERYIPHSRDSRTPGVPVIDERDDLRCLQRVKATLRRIEGRGHGSLRKLELYQPNYHRTRAFTSADVAEVDVLEAIPASVRTLDLSTLELDQAYVRKRLGLQAEREGSKLIAKGLGTLILQRAGLSSETETKLGKRSVEVVWV